MSAFQLSVPSKTFLLGEYAVLQGGPALVLTTAPRFTLFAKQLVDEGQLNGIHPESPAGKLVQLYPKLGKYRFDFIDNHRGKGGFGASTAQFLMITALRHYLAGKKLDNISLLQEYESVAWDGKGVPPSGVDLIAQLHGGICYYHKAINQLKTLKWPFKDIDYCLIHTGNKIATHEHLKQVGTIDVKSLEEIVNQGLESFEDSNSKLFLSAIKQYYELLKEKNLVAESTKLLMQQISQFTDVMAAKGCGALGVDVIVVFYKRNSQTLLPHLKAKGFNIITHGHEIEKGLTIAES